MNPLDILCPVCLAAAGDDCRNKDTDEIRTPHTLRQGYAAEGVTTCPLCKGFGWRPVGLETKGGA